MAKSRPQLHTRRHKNKQKKATPAEQLPPPPLLSPTRKGHSLSMRNPERIEIGFKSGSTASKHLGLSPFEYSNTIEGRIEGRSGHHLSFEKARVNRIIN